MIIKDLKDKISRVFRECSAVQVYLVLKEEGELTLKLADIEDQKTEPKIKKMFCDYIQETILKNDDLEVCDLSTADGRSDAIYHYDYNEYPDELELFQSFEIKKAINEVKKFNFKKDELSKLYGYVIYIGSMQQGISLFKKHYPFSLIKRDSYLLGKLKSEERFELITGKDMIRLNGITQLLCIEGEIYAMDIRVLEQNMGFNKLIHRAAEETVQAIDSLALLEDIQVLKDSAEDITFARKLSKVKKSSPIFELDISKETIIKFTKETEDLAGKFKYSEDGNTIRLDTKKSKDTFVKLMNDAFLRSELTKQYYEARSKDNITQSS